MRSRPSASPAGSRAAAKRHADRAPPSLAACHRGAAAEAASAPPGCSASRAAALSSADQVDYSAQTRFCAG